MEMDARRTCRDRFFRGRREFLRREGNGGMFGARATAVESGLDHLALLTEALITVV
jgi:hypothetical protein